MKTINLNQFKERLKKYSEKGIIFKSHAEIRAIHRGIDLEEIKSNILNPEKLVYVEEQDSKKEFEEKFGCYFAYSENHCHKYIILLNGKVIIVTIININRNWQRIIR